MFTFSQRAFFQKTSDDAGNVPIAKFGTVE